MRGRDGAGMSWDEAEWGREVGLGGMGWDEECGSDGPGRDGL